MSASLFTNLKHSPMNDFSQAVERFVQSTSGNDFITNLHTIYKQIQASSPNEVIATFNTLGAIAKANEANILSLGAQKYSATKKQIEEMQKACASRVAQLVLMDKKTNGWIGKLFDSMTNFDLNINNGRELIKAVM